MVPYEAFDPDVEVHGQTILTVIDGALARFSEQYRDMAHDVLAENGLEDPDPDDWYPQQAWLDTFEVLSNEVEPHILDRLGEQIPDAVEWPGRISGVREGLAALNEAYQMNHRGGEIGYYRFEQLDERVGTVRCKNPYTCPFDRGLIRATTRRYAPVEAFVFVEERGENCRRSGADECTYTVFW